MSKDRTGLMALGAKIGTTRRHNGPDDPRLPDYQREMACAQIEQFVRKVLDEAPPLTPAQRARLAALLGAGE